MEMQKYKNTNKLITELDPHLFNTTSRSYFNKKSMKIKTLSSYDWDPWKKETTSIIMLKIDWYIKSIISPN